jgi:tetratricopeptide (TPR) repeat protein
MGGALATAMAMVLKMVVCAAISFVGAYWILSAWFDRRIAGREALVLATGLAVLQFYAVSLALHGGAGILLLLGTVGGAGLLMRRLSRRSAEKISERLDEQEITRYLEVIDREPENAVAHSLLGDTYRRIGRLELAVGEYEEAVRLDPSLREERYWLERLRADLERRSRKEMSCPRCGALRPKRALECPECGRPYSSIETWSHTIRVMEPRRKAMWFGLGVGALIAVAAMLALAPGKMKLAAVIVLVLTPIAMMIVSARIRRTTG